MGEKKKYPIGSENYVLYEEIGQGVSASVHRALCKPLDEIVAIKILDFERDNADLTNISREVQTMILVDHPNVLKSHCSFVSDHNLWVVMPFMSGGSCLHILKAAHPDGFEEAVIATILKEVLKGLEYLHQHGHIHRDVKAGNILIGSRGVIKLGDFGVSACLFDSGDRQRMRNTFVGTPCWMAPEVMEQLHGYDFKADIWSFGITGLELAHGHAPFSKYPPMKVLLMTLQNAPPGLDYERDKKFSKSFKQMIASCLVKVPSKRPSAKKLLKHSFFKQARSNDYISRTLLEGLPPLGDRIKELKRKEEDMLAQKKMPDGEKEEISQNEYKRGISGWNFNLDDLKVQASLMPDEDAISHNVCSGSSSSLSALDTQEKQSEYTGPNTKMENNDVKTRQSSLPLISSSTVIAKCEKSDDDSGSASPCCEQHVSQNSSPEQVEFVENIAAEKPAFEINGKTTVAINIQQKVEGASAGSKLSQNIAPKQGDSFGNDSGNLQNQPQNVNGTNGSTLPSDGDTSKASQSSDGDTSKVSKSSDRDTSKASKSTDGDTSKASRATDGDASKTSKATDGDASKTSKATDGDASKASKSTDGDTSKASKLSANSDEVDEKAKPPVVQQRGRFKVTSENVDVDKTAASPMLQKSHSMQVLTQINGTPAPVATSASTPPISSTSHGASIFPLLNSVLQSNISQRDNVLQAMRQLVGSENAGDTVPPEGASLVVQLEAAHEREKELLHEITELQWRLICAQEEIQKYKTENAQV